MEARPIDEQPLRVRGGVFTTMREPDEQDVGYNYWSRNIMISRSNTEVDGLKHHVDDETASRSSLLGLHHRASNCANVTLRDCFATAHRTYKTIGAAGKPVSMGTYDYPPSNVVNFTMISCRMDDISDRSDWGVIGTNFCKNILLEDCCALRMDTHMGVSGTLRHSPLYAGPAGTECHRSRSPCRRGLDTAWRFADQLAE